MLQRCSRALLNIPIRYQELPCHHGFALLVHHCSHVQVAAKNSTHLFSVTTSPHDAQSASHIVHPPQKQAQRTVLDFGKCEPAKTRVPAHPAHPFHLQCARSRPLSAANVCHQVRLSMVRGSLGQPAGLRSSPQLLSTPWLLADTRGVELASSRRVFRTPTRIRQDAHPKEEP
jgi:hypothetical protein